MGLPEIISCGYNVGNVESLQEDSPAVGWHTGNV